jgi:hypothetical protein
VLPERARRVFESFSRCHTIALLLRRIELML